VDIKALLGTLAPTLGSALLGPLSGVAVAALGKVFGMEEATKEKIKQAITQGQMTPEQVYQVKALEAQYLAQEAERGFKYADLEFRTEELIQTGVTRRWESDMGSKSSLSQNIRPMVLLYLLALYAIFALLSAFNINVTEAYVTLLGNWGMLVMTAYFGGRTVEKVVSMTKAVPQNRAEDKT